MKRATQLIAVAMVAATAGAALADGMIVPVRPDIRVRGSWAVKYHHVDIRVRDQVALVSIDQEFVNTGSQPIEVEYLFPVPPDAAVDSMTLMVDGKEFAARLLDADDARRIYEDIVRRKKDPALLEYVGFGLYRTRAFPLQPNKPVRVAVTYKNVCRKDRNVVEVWYPLNTEKFSARPIEDVRVTVDIRSNADLPHPYSPTHEIRVERKDPRHVVATWHATNALPSTDLQVFYRESQQELGATLVTHHPRAAKDGYFMMLVSPAPYRGDRPALPKDVVLVLDRSGSMSGAKIRQVREAAEFVLGNLNSKDRFNVIAYNDSIERFFDGLAPVTEENVRDAVDSLDRIEARGPTDIHKALVAAMDVLSADSGRPAYVIFLTDGKPTIGETAQRDILADTKAANDAGARLFAFGVGYDVNVRLLDRLAGDNHGRSHYVKPSEPIEEKICSLYAKIRNPVMTDVAVSVRGLRLRDMYPRSVGDLFEGDQLVLVGRYDGRDLDRPHSRSKPVETRLTVTGTCAGARRVLEYPVEVCAAGRGSRFEFVEKIWAIRRVGFLLDEIQLHGKSKEVVDELIRLSRAHGIMTPYTSFLAEETGRPLDDRRLSRRMLEETRELRNKISGEAGQRGAVNRDKLNTAGTVQQPAAPVKDADGNYNYDSSVQVGHSDRKTYESNGVEVLGNVRQVGNNTLYRYGRSNVWVAAQNAEADPQRDAARIEEVERFSAAYFELVRANSVAENQLLASQRANEELLIRLRGQLYLIR